MKHRKMKRILLNKIGLIVLFIAIFSSSNAQHIDKVFLDAPENVLPYVNKTLKLEMLEYYKQSSKKDTVQHLLGGKAVLLDMDTVHHYIKLQPAENTRMEIKLFPIQNQKTDSASYVIGVIHTVCAPLCSSYVRFYDHQWDALPLNMPMLTAADWLKNKEETKDGIPIANVFKSSFIEFSFDKILFHMSVKNNSMNLLSAEDKLFFQPFIQEENKKMDVFSDGKTVKVTF